jgi:hypothetical protein
MQKIQRATAFILLLLFCGFFLRAGTTGSCYSSAKKQFRLHASPRTSTQMKDVTTGEQRLLPQVLLF